MHRNPENTTPKQPLRKKIGCKHPRLRIPWKQHRWISQTFAVRDGARQAFWAMISRKQNWIRSFEIERRPSRRSPSFLFWGGGIVWNPGKCQSFMELDWWNGCCHCFPDPVLPQFASCWRTDPWGDDPIWRAYFSNGCFNHQLVNEPLNCTWFVTIPDDLDRFEEPVEEPSSFMREPEEASTKACDLWAKKSRWFYYPG